MVKMRVFDNRWIVRDFQPQDYKQVINLWIETNLTRPERGDNLDVILRTIEHGGKLLVLEDNTNNQVVGTSWITNDGRRLHLQYFGILPGYQGKKLSHYLMVESLRFAKQTGLQIKLEVHQENFRAINLYQKWGFKRLGDYDIYILRDVELIDIE